MIKQNQKSWQAFEGTLPSTQVDIITTHGIQYKNINSFGTVGPRLKSLNGDVIEFREIDKIRPADTSEIDNLLN